MNLEEMFDDEQEFLNFISKLMNDDLKEELKWLTE